MCGGLANKLLCYARNVEGLCILERDDAMHQRPLNFVQAILSTAVPTSKVSILEIGSYDVNGSIRPIVRKALGLNLGEYIGIDLTLGPGVDVVASGSEVPFSDGRFDLVLSLECFEHNPYWKETFGNMIRLLQPGGWCVITCASTGRPEHGTPRIDRSDSPGTDHLGWTYYKNLALSELRGAAPLNDTFSHYTLQFGAPSNDLYFAGLKKGSGSALQVSADYKQVWSSAGRCSERASLKRRATYTMERLLGSRRFQDLYVHIWHRLKFS
jgi:SAM-dependent methyltransferase